MTKTGQRIIQGQAWVDDRRTVSRGQGRENKPGARAGIRTQEIYLGILGNALYAAGLTILGSEWEKVQVLCSVCVCVCDWVMVIVRWKTGASVIIVNSCVGAVDDGKCSL